MIEECTLNLGIECPGQIDLGSATVLEFSESVTQLVPQLDQVEQDEERKSLSVFQQGKVRHRREVVMKVDGLQAAAGTEVPADERFPFILAVATAADRLKLSKFRLVVVDLRFVFRIIHWGNHHDLVADTLFRGGRLKTMFDDFASPLTNVELTFTTRPRTGADIVLGVNFVSNTSRREIRSGEYDGDAMRVVCGLGRVGGFIKAGSFKEIIQELHDVWTQDLETTILSNVVEPLREASVTAEPRKSD